MTNEMNVQFGKSVRDMYDDCIDKMTDKIHRNNDKSNDYKDGDIFF